MIIIDEAPLVDENTIAGSVAPIRSHTRPIMTRTGNKDFVSKMVMITSAPLKSTYFYTHFMKKLDAMAKKDRTQFACAINYEAVIRAGIHPAEFFESERRDSTEASFQMEYNSVFVGAEMNSVFPYDLVESCRTLSNVEYAMPNSSKAKYIMSLDFASSERETGDNAVITVIKLSERPDGSYMKHVVFIRSYHGWKHRKLVQEMRDIYLRFPNIEKIIYDKNGPGSGLDGYMMDAFTDPATGKELPGWIADTININVSNTIPILREIIASQEYNKRLTSSILIALERKTIALPINSRYIYDGVIEDGEDDNKPKKKMRMEEVAIYKEADALQVELGTIIPKLNEFGQVVTYVPSRSKVKKDRYSSLGMALEYLYSIEVEKKMDMRRTHGEACYALVSDF